MFQRTVVIGAGTMGNGIAHVMAQAGISTTLVDTNNHQLQVALETISKNLDRQIKKGILTETDKVQTLSHVTITDDLIQAVQHADLVIEAATENLDIKLKIFKQVDELAPEHCILASNTSSISITKISTATLRPHKVIGMHFMNPVPVMKLVEIINGKLTEKEVTQSIVDLCLALGKTPCIVNDAPGFISNRILMPMINEAIYALHEGVAEKESIDTIMKLGMAHPMGPLQLADLIGLDTCLNIITVLREGFNNPKYDPCPLLISMVNAGKLGVKTGEGFYKY